jgi:hypothetical protein
MMRTVRITGIVALMSGAIVMLGGVVLMQVVLLSMLGVAVVLGAVAFSIEQSFRLLEGAGRSRVPTEPVGARLPR